jgi:hypothetical protein
MSSSPWVKRQVRPTATSAPQGGVRPERGVSTILDQIFKHGNEYPVRTICWSSASRQRGSSESIVTHFQFQAMSGGLNLVHSFYAVAFALEHKMLSLLRHRGEGTRIEHARLWLSCLPCPRESVDSRPDGRSLRVDLRRSRGGNWRRRKVSSTAEKGGAGALLALLTKATETLLRSRRPLPSTPRTLGPSNLCAFVTVQDMEAKLVEGRSQSRAHPPCARSRSSTLKRAFCS